jgi:hypothetical protein
MNNLIKIFGLTIVLLFTNCKDSFLERYPLDQVSNETFWKTTNDLEIFINGIYNMTAHPSLYAEGYDATFMLVGNGPDRPFGSATMQNAFIDLMSDDQAPMHSRVSSFAKIKTGNNTVPGSVWDTQNFDGWWWYLLRNINTFMDNYQRVTDISEEILNKYVGEVRMFRAWFYWDKVKRFGGVPLYTHALNIDDTDILYGPRSPRSDVMDLVLEDIIFACENLPDNWQKGSPGYMNKWAALALKSRICLYEGTYQKYHGGTNATMWLTEAANAAKQVMDSGLFSLYNTGNSTTDYRYSFHQKDLSGNPEIIYWKKYIDGINPHNAMNYYMDYQGGATRDFVEDYLCTDGMPISQSSLYQGDDDIESTFMNRDPRIRQTILHPDDSGPDKPLHLAGGSTIPYPLIIGQSGDMASRTGYLVIKFYDDNDWTNYNHETTASVIFRYGEVLLNYAEAKAELGSISQGDLDISINLLRDRVGMPHINLNNIAVDPKYDYQGLAPVIIEIRRERRVELFGEGFRYDDLIRWKTAQDRLNKPTLGIQWNEAAIARFPLANVKTSVDPASGKTYINVYKGTAYETTNFTDKNYLWPIPTWALSENPELKQNTGW